MTRRILRLSVLVALIAGCGGGSKDQEKRVAAVHEAQKAAAERFEAMGGIRARFNVSAGDGAAMLAALRERALALKLDTNVSEDGPWIVVESAAESAREARQAIAALTTPGRLAFYDWEANVVGPDGRPAPDDPTVTGGANAGTGAALTRREARERAKEGMVVVRAEQPDDVVLSEKTDQWYVLRDRPALTGEDLVDPKQEFDQRGNGEPMVVFDLTERGQAAFEELTRVLAQRGKEQQLPGTDPLAAAQHFAIVLDDEIITTPFIDFVENPDGFSLENGSQIAGGFTIESAQRLAATLRQGPLPAALEPRGEERVDRR